jgi:hypothetical protein
MQDLLIRFAIESARYRQALIADPKGLIERQFKIFISDLDVRAVVDTADTLHVIVPYVPESGELTEADLGRVAGGAGRKAHFNEFTVTHNIDKASPVL